MTDDPSTNDIINEAAAWVAANTEAPSWGVRAVDAEALHAFCAYLERVSMAKGARVRWYVIPDYDESRVVLKASSRHGDGESAIFRARHAHNPGAYGPGLHWFGDYEAGREVWMKVLEAEHDPPRDEAALSIWQVMCLLADPAFRSRFACLCLPEGETP